MPDLVTDSAPGIEVAQPPSDESTLQPLCHIVTPVGCLGFGLEEDVCDAELAQLTQTNVPSAIILDSGSTDSGPGKLGHGTTSAPRSAYVRDLGKLMRLVHKYHVPLLFSSAGGDGSGKHVDEMLEVIREVQEASASNYSTKALAVYADVSKDTVRDRLATRKISGCGPVVPKLTDDDIEGAPTIVAQMGIEPFLDAMYAEPDYNVVVGGRSYDPAPFVAFMAYTAMGASRRPVAEIAESALGGFFHIGKILECGAHCAVPKTKAARATIYVDGTFDIAPLEPGARCTAVSVAAHTMYEKSRPDLLYGPGGCLDLTSSTYAELEDKKSVRSKGARFRHSFAADTPYTVKLEGARTKGYRTMFFGAFRDPILTGQLDEYFSRVHAYVKQQHKHYPPKDWKLRLHKMGAYHSDNPGEVCVIGETLGATQELANSVANIARVACVHGPYPGQKANSGALAFGIGGKTEIEAGPCAEFCIYHLMEVRESTEGAMEIFDSPVKNNRFVAPRTGGPLFSWRHVHLGQHPNPGPTSSVNKTQPIVLKLLAQVPNGTLTNRSSKAPEQPIVTLGDAAQLVRSKNSGPYEITFDLLFGSASVYKAIKTSGLLTAETIASLYGIQVEQMIYCGFFDQALAFKATIPRMMDGKPSVSGNFGEDDVHGSQMYLPLMRMHLPEALSQKLQAVSHL